MSESLYYNSASSPLGELYEIFGGFDIQLIRRATLMNKHLPLVMPWHYAEAKWLKDNAKSAFGLCFPAAYVRVVKFLDALKKYNESVYAGYLIESAERYCQLLFYFVGSYVCANGTDGLNAYMTEIINEELRQNDYDNEQDIVRQYARVQAVALKDLAFCFEQMWLYLMSIGSVEWAKKTVRSWSVKEEYKELLNNSYQSAKQKNAADYDRKKVVRN